MSEKIFELAQIEVPARSISLVANVRNGSEAVAAELGGEAPVRAASQCQRDDNSLVGFLGRRSITIPNRRRELAPGPDLRRHLAKPCASGLKPNLRAIGNASA